MPKSKPADARTIKAYKTRHNLFAGSAERALFSALIKDAPDGYHVFSKVRLEDIIGVKPQKDLRLHWQYRGRIKSRHVDFLICDKGGQFICAIELDGPSHNTREAEMIDGFKDAVFSHVGLKLYRVQVGTNFERFAQNLWAQISR